MDKQTYKRYIIEMVEKIDNISHLKRIYTYIHKLFIQRTGD